jgi:hypothetical protein
MGEEPRRRLRLCAVQALPTTPPIVLFGLPCVARRSFAACLEEAEIAFRFLPLQDAQ